MQKHDCPGPNRKEASVPEDVQCPKCGAEVEMWSDDKKATCSACGVEFTRAELDG